MKKIVLILFMVPAIAFAQKAAKPNTGKILSLYQEGKLKEAKEQADITVTGEKTAVDGKAWYYRGLVYAALDTTADASLKSLEADPLKVAIESFKKADELNKKKDTEFYTNDPGGIVPTTKSQQLELLSNYYLDKGIKLMQQDEPDYQGSYAKTAKARYVFENAMTKYSNDTLAYYVQSLAALNVQRYDSSAEAANKYLERGGKSADIYLVLNQIYSEKGDKVKALEVIKEARKRFPFNEEFTKSELNIYLTTKQYDQAKKMVEEQLQVAPSAESYYMLGELNRNLNKIPEATVALKKAIELDPSHYDANASMAELTYDEVKSVRAERDALKDNEKRRVLYQKIEKELRESVVYWEKLEVLKPNEENVLYGLQSIYGDLAVYDDSFNVKLEKLKKKMRSLKMEVD